MAAFNQLNMNTTNETSDLSSEFCNSLRLICEFKHEDDTISQFNFDELIVDEEDEHIHFNKVYGTGYNEEDLRKFNAYKDHYGLKIEDAFTYIQFCHNCGFELRTFAGEYCSGGCHNHVEELGMPCFRGANCLICSRGTLPNVTTLPKVTNLLNEIDEFYLEYYGRYNSLSCCLFIEGNTRKCPLDNLRIHNWKLMKSYAARANLSVKDVEKHKYIYYCHCCGQDLEYIDMKGEMYCSYECENAIETDGYMCHFNDCLMCQDKQVFDTAPFLERISKFYYLCGFNESYNKWDGFGVGYFRKLENIAAIKNITLQEARTFDITGELPFYETHPHPLIQIAADFCVGCARCQYADADLTCGECNYSACFNCYYTTVYTNCVSCFNNNAIIEDMQAIEQLFVDDKADLAQYAHDYGVTMLQAYRGQHSCHLCKKDVTPHSFGPGHQFCSARCEVIFEQKPFSDNCIRCKGERINCNLCDGEVLYLNLEITKRERELMVREPVLATIHVFKELLVYNELFGCLPDLIDFY